MLSFLLIDKLILSILFLGVRYRFKVWFYKGSWFYKYNIEDIIRIKVVFCVHSFFVNYCFFAFLGNIFLANSNNQRPCVLK